MAVMSGKRALLEQLIADGTCHIFGNPGTTEQGFMDILQDYPSVQFVLALHEGVAVSMADAYARITRRPAFVELHIAPGLGNALGMLHNARIGKTPLVVYAGQSPSNVLLQEPHLSGPLVDMARPIAKWAAQVEHAHDVPRALRRAFKIAAEPPQGPVFLALPMDVLDAEADVEIAPTTYTNWRARPDAAGLAELADLLVRAQRPMLMVVGAPVFQLIFPEPEHPVLGPRTRLAQLDCISHEIGKNVRPDIGLLGDPKSGLAELEGLITERLQGAALQSARERRKHAEARVAQVHERYWANARKNWDSSPISGARLMHEIKRALPENALVFSEGVTNTKHVEMAIAPEAPAQLVKVRGGGIGPGLPGALGAALARPDRKVVGIASDGAAMYSVTALWTAAHYKIPVTYVMLSNREYRILKLNMLDYLGPGAQGRQFVGMDLVEPELRFDQLAEAMGVPARRVDTQDELAPALEASTGHQGGPFLLDVVLDSPALSD